MNEWQPIETAPKDGTWVLLFVPEGIDGSLDNSQMHTAIWDRSDYNSEKHWVFGPLGYEHSFRRGIYDATHWMPLPAPPTAQ